MKIIIFGNQQLAELAHFYLNENIVAFTLHQRFIKENTFKGLPVVPFENIENIYPPNEYLLFAPMTGKNLNQDRKKVFDEGKTKGYKFYTYISPNATVLTDKIGENCFILEDNTIQPFVEIGNNVVLWSGNHIGHHGKIDDHVFFTSHVVLSGNCHVESFSWFGVNATIRNNLQIKEGTLVSMGACLTKNTEPYTLWLGVPAKNIGPSNTEKIMSSL